MRSFIQSGRLDPRAGRHHQTKPVPLPAGVCRLQPAVLRLAQEFTSGTATPDLTPPKSQHLVAFRLRRPSPLRFPRGAGAGSARSRPPTPSPLQISPAAASVGPGCRAQAKLGCVPGDGDAARRCAAPGGRLRRGRRSEGEPGLCSSPRIQQLAGRVVH
jgi:hypothetical protein